MLEATQATPEPTTAPVTSGQEAEQIETVDTGTPDPSTESEITNSEVQPAGTDDIEVDVDGTPARVKAEEARLGYLRERDYTQKTMALAEKERAIATRLERLDTSVNTGEALVNVLANEFQAEFQGVNWGELATNDPAAYVQKRHAYDERQRKLQLAVGQLNQAKAHQSELQSEATQQRIAEEQKFLLDKLPDWKDAKKATVEAAKVREYLTKSGYDSNEVNGVTDHRAVILARKAMLYDELAAKLPKPGSVTAAPTPVPKAPTRATGEKDPAQMSDKEFATWRARQIAQRR
jgi:hypothetical protein